VNSSISPAADLNNDTDQNGVAIFYGLPPQTTNYTYNLTATKASYSSLTTIVPNGTLQPTYSNQRIFSQQSSFLTLQLRMQGVNSLLVETTDPSGTAIGSVKVYLKGGYKRYTATTDTSYCYDNMRTNGTPPNVCSTLTTTTDNRPVTDGSGLIGIDNLVPGTYVFCGDAGATSCTVGTTTYYLAAAVPYSGLNPFNPVTVPTYDPANPPATTFAYNSFNYLQKIRLLLTTNATYPRITSLSPYDLSLAAGNLSNFAFTVKGVNLPCSSTASSCGTIVKFLKGGNTYTASCTGTTGTQLNCTVNLTGITTGQTQMVVSANGNTLTLPGSPLIGGLVVAP
jgi:hypothetical protein